MLTSKPLEPIYAYPRKETFRAFRASIALPRTNCRPSPAGGDMPGDGRQPPPQSPKLCLPGLLFICRAPEAATPKLGCSQAVLAILCSWALIPPIRIHLLPDVSNITRGVCHDRPSSEFARLPIDKSEIRKTWQLSILQLPTARHVLDGANSG